MRYLYQEPVIHTVTDEDLTDDKAIRETLDKLREMNHNVFMEFDDPQNPDHLRRLESVRITAVSETSVDLHAFFSNATMKFKGVPILSIRKVRLLASKQSLSKKYKVTRWHMMDVAEIEGI